MQKSSGQTSLCCVGLTSGVTRVDTGTAASSSDALSTSSSDDSITMRVVAIVVLGYVFLFANICTGFFFYKDNKKTVV